MKKNDSKLVWTSDPEEARRIREHAEKSVRSDEPPSSQTIRVAIDRAKRRGRSVTVATGFRLAPDSMRDLARELKASCGAGGKASDDTIEIQGEHVDGVASELIRRGFKVRR